MSKAVASFLLLGLLTGGCRAGSGPPPDLAAPLLVEAEDLDFRLVSVAAGLKHPWSVAFLPDGDFLITERPGRLRRLKKDGTLVDEPLAGVPEVVAQSQGGLFDVVLHPDFPRNSLVYLTYAKPGPQGSTTAVLRGKLGAKGLEGVQEVFEADAWGRIHKHFGGRLVFDRQGFFFLSVGDRKDSPSAQNPATHAGKILRLHDDGRTPKDNPFAGRAGYRPEIYTMGNRNPQGLYLDPASGDFWETEHGPRGGDEVNLIKAGANYGWPTVTFGIDYDGGVISEQTEAPGLEPPVLHWTPSISPSGLMLYDGTAFEPWKGNLFSGALSQTHLRRIVLEDGKPVHQEELLRELRTRIRTVVQGPDGRIYLLTDANDGRLLRLDPVTR